MDIEELRESCHEVVVRQINKYGWGIWTAEEYIQEVFARVKDKFPGIQPSYEVSESDITKIAVEVYALVLYDACNPKKNPPDQERLEEGYAAVGRFLYNNARIQHFDTVEDVQDAIQQALKRIYEAFLKNEIREPGAFLEYCRQQLRGARTKLDRAERMGGEKPLSWEEMTSADEANSGFTEQEPAPLEPSHESVEAVVEQQQFSKAVQIELRQAFKAHPRAKDQLKAAILKHSFECKNQEIGHILRISNPNKISRLISSGTKKLKKSEGLKKWYEQEAPHRLRGEDEAEKKDEEK